METLNVVGKRNRAIPWSAKERKTKNFSIMHEKIPGGSFVAVPEIYFSTLIMDDEHRTVVRNRMERRMRVEMELPEARELANLIIGQLK